MAFVKNGETKVYKRENKIGTKLASEDESNRFTIDDLVKRSIENELDSTSVDSVIVENNGEEKEDVSN